MQRGVPEEQLPPKLVGFTPEDYGHERVARKGLERLAWELDRYEPIAFSVYNGRTPEMKAVLAPLRMPADRMTDGELEETCILAGGDPFSPKDPVKPGVLSVAARRSGASPAAVLPTDIDGRRTALAEWIASPGNPLTIAQHRESHLAVALWTAHRRQSEQLRRHGQEADASRTARLAGRRVRGARLVDQGDAPPHHVERGVLQKAGGRKAEG